MRTVTIPTGADASTERLAPLLCTLPLELRGDMERFVAATFQVCGVGSECPAVLVSRGSSVGL